MPDMPDAIIRVKTDNRALARTARIIAKHLTALADELETEIISFAGPLTKEQVAEIRRRLREEAQR